MTLGTLQCRLRCSKVCISSLNDCEQDRASNDKSVVAYENEDEADINAGDYIRLSNGPSADCIKVDEGEGHAESKSIKAQTSVLSEQF